MAPTISKAEAASTAGTLPKQLLIAVPLDAQGKEINDKAVFATNKESVTIDQSNAAKVFLTGQTPKVSELDENSSRQSFFGWRIGCGRNCGGRFHGGRGNFYNINYGNQQINLGGNGYQNNVQPFAGNWNTYQPSYHQNNYDWSYGCQNSYSNVNFSSYNQSSFSSQNSSNFNSNSNSSFNSSAYSAYNVYAYNQNSGYGWNGNQPQQ